MKTHARLAIAVVAAFVSAVSSQGIRTGPYPEPEVAYSYNGQLRTTPEVGNVQGIQRYGRPLRTDPDQGEGYSYHVYPVAYPHNNVMVAGGGEPERMFAAGLQPQRSPLQLRGQVTEAAKKEKEAFEQYKAAHELAQKDPKNPLLQAQSEMKKVEHQRALMKYHEKLVESFQGMRMPAMAILETPMPVRVHPEPFIPTRGARLAAPVAVLPAAHETEEPKPPPKHELPVHHPLIQVKVRVVEVERTNLLLASSVLDYISSPGRLPTLISGNNVNNDMRNLSAGSRFFIPDGFINFSGKTLASLSPAGALVNLTTGNLNYIARLLQTQFHADTITAPQVVTLNGQNVEFVAGQRVPFLLGQNVIQGNNNNIQQFFYKHVGTYISVTPTIINWGENGSGRGRAPLTEAEVLDWDLFIGGLLALRDKSIVLPRPLVDEMLKVVPDPLVKKADQPKKLVPVALRAAIVGELNRYAKEDLLALGLPIAVSCGSACSWRPEDCTIDLNVVMRLSGSGTLKVGGLQANNTPTTADVPIEDNVRALANIVQVQSGHGVILGGLISEHDVRDVSKIPVLGDIPVVGAFFRSKSTNRQKTEILLFIEAQVLDPCPLGARAQSANDFVFSQPFVAGGFLDNPLELGMYRAGFGGYLPPNSPQERVFWERLGRKVRTIVTTIDDILE